MKLLTRAAEDNNGFDAWTEDGKQIAIDSSRNDPASRDSFMIDVATGETKLVAKNPGVGGIEGISRDGKRALLSRLKNRGDNNLYLLDLASGKDTLITKHDGVATLLWRDSAGWQRGLHRHEQRPRSDGLWQDQVGRGRYAGKY